jgi:hypothetical protein
MNRMVTKGYQKGVYERVTKGTEAGEYETGLENVAPASCRLPEGVLALNAAGEDARRTAAGTAALLFGASLSMNVLCGGLPGQCIFSRTKLRGTP